MGDPIIVRVDNVKKIPDPGATEDGAIAPKARQLRLLPSPKPLTERIGREFFLGIPRVPGVYFMYDESGALLYVGKSCDLRNRLNSYRHTHPDRDSRKTMRLVHQVRRIEWRVCESPSAAVLLENELLRTLRPPFNRENTWPQACLYLGTRSGGEEPAGGLFLRASRERAAGYAWFGAFKPACLGAHAALARCLFAAVEQPSSVFDLPFGYGSGRVPREVSIRSGNADPGKLFGDLLRDYLSGENDRLIAVLEDLLQAWASTSPQARGLVAGDLEFLKGFFKTGPARVRRFARTRQDGNELLHPEELLDFLALEGCGARCQSAPGSPVLGQELGHDGAVV